MSKPDPINPSHYKSHPSGVECVVITEHMTFCAGNAVKYLWRSGLKVESADKSKREATLRDLKKAQWYVTREIARLEKQK